MVNVKPGQLQSVAKYNNTWRLRPLVTATALAAQGDPTHPLALAATRTPGLLNTINQIATVGGGAGHAHGETVPLEEANRHVEDVYATVAVLLGIRQTQHAESIGDSHGQVQ